MKKVLVMTLCFVLLITQVAFGADDQLFKKEYSTFRSQYGAQYFIDHEGNLWTWGSTYDKNYEEVLVNTPIKVNTQVAMYSGEWLLKKDGSVYNDYVLGGSISVVVKVEGKETPIKVSKIVDGFLMDSESNLYVFNQNEDLDYEKRVLRPKLIVKKVKEVRYYAPVVVILDQSNTLWVWSQYGKDEYGISGNGEIGYDYQGDATLIKALENVSYFNGRVSAVYAINASGDLYGWGKYSIEGNLTPKKLMTSVQEVFIDNGLWQHFKMKDGTLKTYEQEYNYDTETAKYNLIKEHKGIARAYDSLTFLKTNGELVSYDIYTDTYSVLYKNVSTYFTEDFMLSYEEGEAMASIKTILMKTDGYLWTSGGNEFGLLGIGTDKNNFMEEQKVMNDVAQYFSAGRSTYVLKKDGSLWGWGRNIEGELGDGTYTNRNKPVKIFEGPSTQKPSTISVYINNVPLILTNQPKVVSGRTLVPMSEFFSALGATVEWVSETKTVKANRGATNISIVIGSTKAVVNGKEVTIDVPAQVIGGRTFVPLAFISQALGDKVEWKGDTKSIYIIKQ